MFDRGSRRVVGDGGLVLFGSTLERIETREVREIFLSVLGAAFFLAPDQRPQRHADQNQHQHEQEAESCHRSHLSLLAEITKVHECRIGYSTYSNSASGWVFASRDPISLPQEPQMRASVWMCSCTLLPL